MGPELESTGWATVDVCIIFGFIAYAIWSGVRSKDQASQNLDEYFLAGRSLPGWKAGLSMAATQFAADTPLLVTGMIATAGIFSMWRAWIYGLSFLLLGFVLAPSWRKARVITDAELTEVRYGSRAATWLRVIKAIYLGTFFNCIVLGWVLLAATRIAEPFLLWHEWLPSGFHDIFVSIAGVFDKPLTATVASPDVQAVLSANNLISILVIVLITTFYSTTGGLRSVVNTDVAQFFLMIAGTLAFVWVVADKAGGLTAIPDLIRERYSDGSGPGGISAEEILAFTPSQAKDATFALCAVIMVQWLAQMNSDGTGYLAQRSMACKSDRDSKIAAVVFTATQTLLRSLMWIPLALGLLVLWPPDPGLAGEALISNREGTYVWGIAYLDLPFGVKGLMVTAMLAALASTVDTHLNWGSSYWTNDIYKRVICEAWRKTEPNPRSLVWVARGANLLILAIAFLVMTQLGSINTAWRISLLLGAGFGGVLLLRWLWWRMTAWGEMSAVISSLILSPLLFYGVTADGDTVSLFGFEYSSASAATSAEAVSLLFMAIVATVVAISVSLWGGPEKMENLQEFYRRARPPGFWGPVSAAFDADEASDKNRLWRGLAATFVCGFSLFCILTCVGSLIAGSPAPTWFPNRTLWLILLGVVGLGLIKVWWKLGFEDDVAVETITDKPRPKL